MLICLIRSASAIALFAAIAGGSTSYAEVVGAADVVEVAGTQSTPGVRSYRSVGDTPFTPTGLVAGNPPVYGKTYGEWGAEWWTWASSFPSGMNPVQDETGELCDLGQSAPVWFLAGSFGVTGVERSCTVPAGTAIFFPLVNATWVEFPGDEIFTDEDIRYLLATAVGDIACQLRATVDSTIAPIFGGGEVPAPVTDWQRPVVRAQSPKYQADLPEGNIFGAPAGLNPRMIAEGYWVMLPPLSPGQHVVTLNAAQCVEREGEPGVLDRVFETEVTYNLTVVRGRNRD